MKSSNQNFVLVYILLVIGQMVICNYFRISPYLYVTILPAMILCIPLKIKTAASMLTAFATGLSVDLLAEGIVGINALALVPVALIRYRLLKIVLGNEAIEKENPFNVRTSGLWKILFALVSAYAVFLAIYIIADGAGTRPVWFNIVRFAVSLVCDSVLAFFIIHILNPTDR